MTSSKRVSIVCLISILLHGGAAFAQNAVVNPDFDTDISNWTPNAAVVAFDATQNAAGAVGSGSLAVTNNIGNGMTVGVSQCVAGPLAPGQYDVGGWILLPTGQAGSGSAGVSAVLYPIANCAGNPMGFQNAIALPATGWALHTTAISVPPGVASARIDARIDMPNSPPPLQAWFDGVRFGPSPTTPVELQGFEVD